MTIVLQAYPDHTDVQAGETSVSRLRPGMRFLHADLPRSLSQDRLFTARLCETPWDGVRLSGIEAPADIEKASALLRVAEATRSEPAASLLILAELDTARAALGLDRFDRAIPRLAGFIFDADALALASGAAAESGLVADLRLRLPLAAKACGVTAFLSTREDGPEARANATRNGYGGLCVTRA